MRNPFLIQKYKASNDFQQWGVSQARNPATPWSQTTSTISSIDLLIQNEQICRWAVQPSISMQVFLCCQNFISLDYFPQDSGLVLSGIQLGGEV